MIKPGLRYKAADPLCFTTFHEAVQIFVYNKNIGIPEDAQAGYDIINEKVLKPIYSTQNS